MLVWRVADNKKVDEVIPREYTAGGQDFGRTMTLTWTEEKYLEEAEVGEGF